MSKIKKLAIGFTIIAIACAATMGIAVKPASAATSQVGLGELFILNQLFSNSNILGGGTLGTGGNSNLGSLFILSQLFGGTSGNILGASGTLGTGGNSNLGSLFILSQLFGGTSGNILN